MAGIRKDLVVALLILTLAVAGCAAAEEPPQACTLIACVNSLEVRVEGALTYPFSVNVRAEEGYFKFVCESAASEIPAGLSATGDCGAATFLMINFSPASVALTLEFPAGTLELVAEPDYEPFQPNGPGCDPECLFGSLVVSVP